MPRPPDAGRNNGLRVPPDNHPGAFASSGTALKGRNRIQPSNPDNDASWILWPRSSAQASGGKRPCKTFVPGKPSLLGLEAYSYGVLSVTQVYKYSIFHLCSHVRTWYPAPQSMSPSLPGVTVQDQPRKTVLQCRLISNDCQVNGREALEPWSRARLRCASFRNLDLSIFRTHVSRSGDL